MFRKRNLVALLMAATLSLGTIGVALADDGGADFSPVPHETDQQIDMSSVWADDGGADFSPVPHNTDQQTDLSVVWA